MPDLKTRIRRLEERSLDATVTPTIVQVIGPSGRTAEQQAIADQANRDGVPLVEITFKDGRRPTV